MKQGTILSGKGFQLIITISLIALLSGCMNSKLTTEMQTGINTVSVDNNVGMPKEMIYYGAGVQAGSLFGLLGALAVADQEQSERDRIMNIMSENGIEPGQIVASEFRKKLDTKKIVPTIVDSGGDATFEFKIDQYGLMYKPFTALLKPRLEVTVLLKKANGEIVWKNKGSTGSYTDTTKAYTFQDYVRDPELLRDSFESAANIIISKIVANIQEE